LHSISPSTFKTVLSIKKTLYGISIKEVDQKTIQKELALSRNPSQHISTEPNISGISRTSAIDTRAIQTDESTISVSEEHQLELMLSNENNSNGINDLDQTIAEANYIDADLTLSETYNFAKPDLASIQAELTDPETEDYVFSLKESLFFSSQSATSCSLSKGDFEHPNSHTKPNTALLSRIAEQRRKIEALSNNNDALLKSRESLIEEMSNLKYSLTKSKAVARKSVIQRDEAIKLKNAALTIAVNERKRRRLIEIKAQKALLKTKMANTQLANHTID